MGLAESSASHEVTETKLAIADFVPVEAVVGACTRPDDGGTASRTAERTGMDTFSNETLDDAARPVETSVAAHAMDHRLVRTDTEDHSGTNKSRDTDGRLMAKLLQFNTAAYLMEVGT